MSAPSKRDLWAAFVEGEEIAETVRPAVAKSWLRSREQGVAPRAKQFPMLAQAEFKARRTKASAFLALMSPTVDNLRRQLTDSGIVIGLYDPEGCQLATYGDPEAMNFIMGLGLLEGATLREARAGTNCVALAMQNRQPSLTVGAEHYCEGFHGLTGSASPVFSLEGEVLGVLVVCGKADAVNASRLLAIAVSTVRLVSGQMRIAKDHQTLDHYYEMCSLLFDPQHEGSLLVSPGGYIRQASSRAMRLLDIDFAREMDEPLEKVARFTPRLSERIRDGQTIRNEGVRIDTAAGKFMTHVDVLPIRDRSGELQGCLVVFRDRETVARGVGRDKGTTARFTFDDILGSSEAIAEAKEKALTAAATSVSILLEGQSGTGKEMFAQAIHNASERRDGPFVVVNCAAIPSELIQSELFGYQDGAFTGARRGGMVGKFEAAKGGTIFLDEIGDMSFDLQSELLRVLESKRIVRVGSHEEIPIDIRVIAATNRRLSKEVAEGNFREDLYYRLAVTKIALPPLRQYAEDIEELVEHFIRQFNEEMGRDVKGMDETVMQRFSVYDWPGNVRSLRNTIEHAVMACREDVIGWGHLPDDLREDLLYRRAPSRTSRQVKQQRPPRTREDSPAPRAPTRPPRRAEQPQGSVAVEELDLEREKLSVADTERALYVRALQLSRGNVRRAAQALGVDRATFYRKMAKLNIDKDRLRREIAAP